MKRKISYIITLSMLTSMLSACAEDVAVNTGVTAYAAFDAKYTDRDCDPSYDNATEINLSSGSQTITKVGTYVLTGSLDGGSVIIDAPETDKVQLVLRDASITSADGPAIYAKQCDKLFITLEGSSTITDSATYTLAEGEDEPDAAIFAKNDVTFNGSGTLNVTGNYKHGIASKDDVKITGGTINITSVEDGLKGRDSVLIKDGTLNITAGTDGIQSNNDSGEDKGRISVDGGAVTIVCGNDGIQAERVLQINGGTIDITAGDEANTEIKTEIAGGFGGGMGGGMRPEGMTEGAMPEGTPPAMSDGEMQRGGMPGGGRGGRGMGGGMRPEGMTEGAMPEGTPPAMTDGEMQQGGMSFDNEASEEVENSVSIKGLKSANALYINGGTITVSAQDDAVHSDIALTVNGGTLSLRSADDAIHAEYDCVINDGDITIERCYEGIEGKAVVINGGNISVNAEDDGINASDPAAMNSMPGRGDESIYVEINGGTVEVVSKVDGIDSNGNLIINGGDVVVDGPSNGMECAIDCDGSAYVNGGEVAASGVSASTTFAQDSKQGSISVIFSSSQAANTTAAIYDSKGNEIKSTTPTRSFSGVVFSSEKLKKGETYTVKCGDVSVDVKLSELRTIVSDTGEAVSGGMGNGMPGDGRGGRKVSFNDVSADAWYSDYVNYVASRGIMEGKDGEFRPETVTTRAEYVTALYKAAGSPAVEGASGFGDVSADAEYANAVAWAEKTGIAEGDGNGSFLPDASLTREMSMTFLYRALGSLNIARTDSGEDVISGFADNADVSDWAKESMNALVNMGVINGTDENKLNPKGELVNAEVATMVCRALGGNTDGMRRA